MSSEPKNIRKPYLSLPDAGQMPADMKKILSAIPKEKEHKFESAGEFVKRLANRVMKWREMLSENEEPVILIFLPSGDVIEVLSIGEDGHSSVVIEGLADGDPCMFISHQASLQVLCYTRKVEKSEKEKSENISKRIGFYVGGEQIDV